MNPVSCTGAQEDPANWKMMLLTQAELRKIPQTCSSFCCGYLANSFADFVVYTGSLPTTLVKCVNVPRQVLSNIATIAEPMLPRLELCVLAVLLRLSFELLLARCAGGIHNGSKRS